MSGFGFRIRVGTTSCSELDIEVQHLKEQVPVGFTVRSDFGTPTINFPDGTVLYIRNCNPNEIEYTLAVSKKAKAIVKKRREE